MGGRAAARVPSTVVALAVGVPSTVVGVAVGGHAARLFGGALDAYAPKGGLQRGEAALSPGGPLLAAPCRAKVGVERGTRVYEVELCPERRVTARRRGGKVRGGAGRWGGAPRRREALGIVSVGPHRERKVLRGGRGAAGAGGQREVLEEGLRAIGVAPQAGLGTET